jgi:hypothetical protein
VSVWAGTYAGRAIAELTDVEIVEVFTRLLRELGLAAGEPVIGVGSFRTINPTLTLTGAGVAAMMGELLLRLLARTEEDRTAHARILVTIAASEFIRTPGPGNHAALAAAVQDLYRAAQGAARSRPTAGVERGDPQIPARNDLK